MSDDLLIRLNDLADARHDDLDVAAEAATRIISLAWEINDAQKRIESLESENAALREAIKCVWVSWHEWRDDPSENTLYFLEREINAAGELIPPTTDKGYDPGMLDRFEREAE